MVKSNFPLRFEYKQGIVELATKNKSKEGSTDFGTLLRRDSLAHVTKRNEVQLKVWAATLKEDHLEPLFGPLRVLNYTR